MFTVLHCQASTQDSHVLDILSGFRILTGLVSSLLMGSNTLSKNNIGEEGDFLAHSNYPCGEVKARTHLVALQ